MAVLPDSDTKLRVTRTVQAPREAVFRAWTEPERLKRWFHPDPSFTTPEADVDLREGGRYRVVMQAANGDRHIVSGLFREIQPPERLVYTWAWEGRDSGADTVVTIELVEADGGTEVIVTHEAFASVADRDEHLQGWGGCLDRLAEHFAA